MSQKRLNISISILVLVLTFIAFLLWGLNKTEDLLKIWGDLFAGMFLIHFGFGFYKKQKEYDRSTEIVKSLTNEYSKDRMKLINEITPQIETMGILYSSLEEGEKHGYFLKLPEQTKNQWMDAWDEMFDYPKALKMMIVFSRSRRPECEELNHVFDYLVQLSRKISMYGRGFLGELRKARGVSKKLVEHWRELENLCAKHKTTTLLLNDVLNQAHIKNYDLEKFKIELKKIDMPTGDFF